MSSITIGNTAHLAGEHGHRTTRIAKMVVQMHDLFALHEIRQNARAQCMLFSDAAHWDRIKIVHCGVDPSIYGMERDGRSPAKRLMFVGRLAGIKGVPLLLEALARLQGKHPGAQLTLIGDGPERAALETKTRDMGLAERVTFTGYLGQADVAEHLNASDALVLPSFAEGVPVVLMEAMAARLPVIASRVAGVQELVEDGVSGFTLPPGDVGALIDALDMILADPVRCSRMGAAGRARVMAEFDAAKEASWLGSLFNASLSGDLPGKLRP